MRVIQLFNFYRRYRWRAADFTVFQQTIVDLMGGLLENYLAGGVFTPVSFSYATMNLTVNPLAGSSSDGYLFLVQSAQVVAIPIPASTSRWDLIVVRKNQDNENFITRPTSPADSVPLNQLQDTSLVRIAGVESGAPSYPAVVAGDIIVCGVKVTSITSVLSASNIDLSQQDRPMPRQKKVRLVSVNTTLTNRDEIVEVDTSSGNINITLPLSNTCRGQSIRIVKLGGNIANVIPQGSDTLAIEGGSPASVPIGQTDDSIELIGNGISKWRKS